MPFVLSLMWQQDDALLSPTVTAYSLSQCSNTQLVLLGRFPIVDCLPCAYIRDVRRNWLASADEQAKGAAIWGFKERVSHVFQTECNCSAEEMSEVRERKRSGSGSLREVR